MIEALRKMIQRLHYPLEVMLVCVRWYAAYPLILRHIEEMMAERGVVVDHATVHRWSIKILPVLTAVFRRRKRPVGTNSRRAGDDHRRQERCQHGGHRGHARRLRRRHRAAPVEIPRQHRRAGPPGQRIVRLMVGFKSFRCASILIAGVETMHMIKKGQLDRPKAHVSTAASQFYSLVF